MKKIQLLTSLFLIFILNQSFTQSQPNYIGTFGVHTDDPSQLKLTIESDGNFTYQDFSDPKNKIDVKGTWKAKNNGIILTTSNSIKFHNKWKFNKDGTVAKSRKGLSFYRLGKLES